MKLFAGKGWCVGGKGWSGGVWSLGTLSRAGGPLSPLAPIPGGNG